MLAVEVVAQLLMEQQVTLEALVAAELLVQELQILEVEAQEATQAVVE